MVSAQLFPVFESFLLPDNVPTKMSLSHTHRSNSGIFPEINSYFRGVSCSFS